MNADWAQVNQAKKVKERPNRKIKPKHEDSANNFGFFDAPTPLCIGDDSLFPEKKARFELDSKGKK